MAIDPITYLSQQITTKRAQAIAAGKTVVTNTSATKTKTPTKTTTKMPELYKGPRELGNVLTSREKHLKSIDSSLIKEAAQSLGLNVKFGLNRSADDWKARNPELMAEWDKVQQVMADLKASKAATTAISSEISASADA